VRTAETEIRRAVRAELQRFAEHMRETAKDGRTYDSWIRQGLDWWIDDLS
jgi:hypothetical protein